MPQKIVNLPPLHLKEYLSVPSRLLFADEQRLLSLEGKTALNFTM